MYYFFFFFKQKTAYEMRISDWSSDVCSSDLARPRAPRPAGAAASRQRRHRRRAQDDDQRADRKAGEHRIKPVGTEHGEHGSLFLFFILSCRRHGAPRTIAQ